MHLQARFVIPGAIAILAFTGPLFCQTGDEKGVIAPAVSLKRIVPGGLKPGSVMDCKIERPIFFVDREVLPAGTRVRLVVSEVTENRRPKTGLARRIAALATGSPRPKGSYAITLRSAAIILPNGDAVPAQAQVLGILDQRRLVASGRRGEPRTTVVVRLTHIPDIPVNARQGETGAATEIPAGTRARVMLMGSLNGSEARAGDGVVVCLVEPIRAGGRVLAPEGSLFEGRVAQSTPPRRLLRPAKLRVNFNRLLLPGGASVPVSTVLSAVDADRGAGDRLDSEGAVSGGTAGKKRFAIDLGMAYATGKIADDLLEEGIKWGFGAAVSGTAATVARYTGIGTGFVFLVIQRGHDVRLPRYTELELTFSRPATF